MSVTYDWSPLFNQINNQIQNYSQRKQYQGLLGDPNSGQGGILGNMSPQQQQIFRSLPPEIGMKILPQFLAQTLSREPAKPVSYILGPYQHHFTDNKEDAFVAPLPQEAKPPQTRTMEDGPNTLTQQWDPQKNDYVTIAKAPRWQPQQPSAAGEGFGSPITVEADDPDQPGQRTQYIAQQDKKTGQWVTGDETRAPLKNVMLPGGVPGGGRAAAQVGRIMTSAQDVASGLANIAKLPVTASTGFWGGRTDYLANQLSDQDIQDTNSTFVGIGKAIGTLDAGGLQTSDTFLKQIDKLQMKGGDTGITKMRNLAEMRQMAENALKAQLKGPLLSSEQKIYAKELIQNLESAVPWTPNDVTAIERKNKPGTQTLQDYAKGLGLGVPEDDGWKVQKVSP